MTSKDVTQLTGGFLRQLRGIFTGLELLPKAFEELEGREAAIDAQESRRAALAAEIASLSATIADLTQKQENLAASIAKQTAAEELKQRTEMTARLSSLRAEVSDGEARLRDIKEALDIITAATKRDN